MIGGGIYLGCALDTYRRLALYWRRFKSIVYSVELLFWLTQTVVLFYLLFRVNHGELRVYVFLATLLGFAIYQVVIARVYRRILESLLRIFGTIIKAVIRMTQVLLLAPIMGLVQIIIAIILFLIQLVGTSIYWILRLCFFPFRMAFKLVWHFMPVNAKKSLHKMGSICSTIYNRCSKWLQYVTFKRR